MIELEKQLKNIEYSINQMIYNINFIPTQKELSEVRRQIDSDLLKVKQRVSILKQNLEIARKKVEAS